MTPPLFKAFKAGPPPPKVVLLPDGMFFTRTIAVPAGSTLAAVSSQVELALETLSPFPPSQLYHGFFWKQGAERALVFAAYRRRFTSEQVAEWDNAELVVPTFASVLGGDLKPNTTMIVPSAEGLTAVYWDTDVVPSRVVFRALPPEVSEQERDFARAELQQIAPTSRAIVLPAPPAVVNSWSEREIVFQADGVASQLAPAQANSLDVRDKEELAALRRARTRDLALWRGFVGLLVALVLLGVGELALIGAGAWQKAKRAQADAQRPVVERIMTAQSLTTRINELSTKRLLVFEMFDIVNQKRPPEEIWFSRAATAGLRGLNVDATTNSPAAVSTYQTALASLPEIEKVEVRDQRTRENLMTFTLVITFKPDALKPAPSAP